MVNSKKVNFVEKLDGSGQLFNLGCRTIRVEEAAQVAGGRWQVAGGRWRGGATNCGLRTEDEIAQRPQETGGAQLIKA